MGSREKLFTAGAASILLLAGCSSVTNAEMRQDSTVEERYGFDYGYSKALPDEDYGLSKLGCLSQTIYASGKVAVIDLEGTRDTISVKANGVPDLSFIGWYNFDQPLTPADSYTESVLESSGCAYPENPELESLEITGK